MAQPYEKDLIPYNALTELVSCHDAAQAKIKNMKLIADDVDKIIKQATGKDYSIFSYQVRDDMEGKASANIRNEFWSYVIKRSQIKAIMSNKRRAELDKQLCDGNLPEFTLQAVMDTLYGWTQSSKESVEQLITETYKSFLPGRWDKYVSNKKYRIGPKVILNTVFNHYVRTLTEYDRAKLLDLDRVFHLLDGKLSPQYPKSIDCIIETALRDRLDDAESEYFKMKWFKNGNMHLSFKKLDVLAKWNLMAGKLLGGIGGEER